MRARFPLLVAVTLTAVSCAADGGLGGSGVHPTPTTSSTVASDPTISATTASAAADAATTDAALRRSPQGPVSIAFVGDVMLGRHVAPVVAGDPGSVFERLRPAIAGADLALANLESPLTSRPHLVGDFALEAEPAAATLLAGAGFDVVGLANNHASDAGPGTLLDTLAAVHSVGLAAVGAGANGVEASAPLIVDVDGVSVGILAFDLTGGQAAGTTPGVNAWDPESAALQIGRLRGDVDVLVVGLHGGVEYLPRPDPGLTRVTGLLVDWGVDIVWGHGAHVAYPVRIAGGPDRHTIVAPGLGNALFDQSLPGTRTGSVLEVLVDVDGVVAVRCGRLEIDAGRTTFEGWDDPVGDAVSLDGDWWTPVRAWSPAPVVVPTDITPAYPPRRVDGARATGDVTAVGSADLVIAYRRDASEHPVHEAFPNVDWVDDDGRSAHLGVYSSSGRLRWAAAIMLQPVGVVAACDGSLALGFTALDEPDVIAGGAWLWDGFGFRTASMLPGPTVPSCADIDGDGRTEPILTNRINSNE